MVWKISNITVACYIFGGYAIIILLSLFDWPTTFWSITWEPEFCQIWGWWWNMNNNISFHLRLFPRKTNDKIFGFSCLNLGKNEFSWKKGLCEFLNIAIIYHRVKNQKNIMMHSWEKWRTDGQTDGQIDRRRWFYRTLHRTGVQDINTGQIDIVFEASIAFDNSFCTVGIRKLW